MHSRSFMIALTVIFAFQSHNGVAAQPHFDAELNTGNRSGSASQGSSFIFLNANPNSLPQNQETQAAQAEQRKNLVYAELAGRLRAEEEFIKRNKKTFVQKIKNTMEVDLIKNLGSLPSAIIIIALQQVQQWYNAFVTSNIDKQQQPAEQFIKAQQIFLKTQIELLKQRETYTALLKAKGISPEFYKKIATYTALCGKEQEYLLLEKCRRLIGRLPDNNTSVASNNPKALLVAHGQQRHLSAQQTKLVAKTAAPVVRSNMQAASLPSSLVNTAINTLLTV